MARRQIVKKVISALLNRRQQSSQTVIPADTRSVYVTDYTDGSSKIVKTETSGTTGVVNVITTRTSSGGGSAPVVTVPYSPTPTKQFNTSTEAGRIAQEKLYASQGVDKFGHTPAYYQNAQRQVKINIVRAETQNAINKVSTEQANYYQNLINKNKISVEEANRQLNKVVNVFARDLGQRQQERLNTQLIQLEREYTPQRKTFTTEPQAKSKFIKGVVKTADLVSGGKITAKKIRKEQEGLNKEVEKYNKDYPITRRLSEVEYAKAVVRYENLDKAQGQIDTQESKLRKSFKGKLGDFYTGENLTRRTKETQQKELNEAQRNLERITGKIDKLEAKGGSKTRIKILKNLQVSTLNEISDIQNLVPKRIMAGNLPPFSFASYGAMKIKGAGSVKVSGIKRLIKINIKETSKLNKQVKSYMIKPSPAQLTKIIKTRARVNKFYKQLAKSEKSLSLSLKKSIPLKKPSALRLKITKFAKGIKTKYSRLRTTDMKTGKSRFLTKAERKYYKNLGKYGKMKGRVKISIKPSEIQLRAKASRLKRYMNLGIKKGKTKIIKYISKRQAKKLIKIRQARLEKYKALGKRKGLRFYIKPTKKMIKLKRDRLGRYMALGKKKGKIFYRQTRWAYIKGKLKGELKSVFKTTKKPMTIKVRVTTKPPIQKVITTPSGMKYIQVIKQKPSIKITIPKRQLARFRIERAIKNMKPRTRAKFLSNIKKINNKVKSLKKKQIVRQYQKQQNKIFKGRVTRQTNLLAKAYQSAYTFEKIKNAVTGTYMLSQLYKQGGISRSKLNEAQRSLFRQTQKTLSVSKTTQTQVSRQGQIPRQTQQQAQRLILKPTQIKPPTTTRIRRIIRGFEFNLNKRTKKILSRKGLKIGFNVYGKSGNKFIKINKKPLSRHDAVSKGAYAIDRTTSRTLRIEPAGVFKSLGYLTKREKGYASRTKHKFRSYKVQKGIKLQLKKKYIEKRKYAIDTGGEKRGLSLARFLRKRNKIVSHKSRRTTKNRRMKFKKINNMYQRVRQVKGGRRRR